MHLEHPCEIVRALQDIDSIEQENASLVLVLSKPRKVTWLKGADAIPLDCSRFAVSIDDGGLQHMLSICNITTGDNGVYTVQVEDNQYGSIFSTCNLTVKGKFTDFHNVMVIVCAIIDFCGNHFSSMILLFFGL